MKVLGIDYSITSPALCLHDGSTQPQWWVNYKPKTKTPYPPLPNVEWRSSIAINDVHRYSELALWVSGIVETVRPDMIVLEDYAFQAAGRITALAENGGALKLTLHHIHDEIPLFVVAPTSMKKFATGSGRAQKEDIWASFVARFPDTHTWPGIIAPKCKTGKINSPLADIADAYFLADYGLTKL